MVSRQKKFPKSAVQKYTPCLFYEMRCGLKFGSEAELLFCFILPIPLPREIVSHFHFSYYVFIWIHDTYYIIVIILQQTSLLVLSSA